MSLNFNLLEKVDYTRVKWNGSRNAMKYKWNASSGGMQVEMHKKNPADFHANLSVSLLFVKRFLPHKILPEMKDQEW